MTKVYRLGAQNEALIAIIKLSNCWFRPAFLLPGTQLIISQENQSTAPCSSLTESMKCSVSSDLCLVWAQFKYEGEIPWVVADVETLFIFHEQHRVVVQRCVICGNIILTSSFEVRTQRLPYHCNMCIFWPLEILRKSIIRESWHHGDAEGREVIMRWSMEYGCLNIWLLNLKSYDPTSLSITLC